MSPCWVLLIFAFAAQASSVIDSHYHDLEDLHNELEEYVTGLQKLELESRETLGKVYELEATRAMAKHRENTMMLMKLANQRNCQKSTLLQLSQMVDSLPDWFSKCMNLTKKLVDYENVSVAIYYEYLELRPMFCDSANTLSLCITESGSIFDKMMCSYQGMQDSIKKFDSLKDKIIDTVKYIQSLIKETSSDIWGCFRINHSAFFSTQNDFIEMNC